MSQIYSISIEGRSRAADNRVLSSTMCKTRMDSMYMMSSIILSSNLEFSVPKETLERTGSDLKYWEGSNFWEISLIIPRVSGVFGSGLALFNRLKVFQLMGGKLAV